MFISISVTFHLWHSGGKECLAYRCSTSPKRWQVRCQALTIMTKQNCPGPLPLEASFGKNATLSRLGASHTFCIKFPHQSIRTFLLFLTLHLQSVPCRTLFYTVLELLHKPSFCFYPRCSVNNFHHIYYILSHTIPPIPLPILSNHYNTSNVYLFFVCFLAKWALLSMHINGSVYKHNCYSSFFTHHHASGTYPCCCVHLFHCFYLLYPMVNFHLPHFPRIATRVASNFNHYPTVIYVCYLGYS